MTMTSMTETDARIENLEAELARVRSENRFLQSEQEPVERRYRQANAEVEALRQLVKDFVADACPVIHKMDPQTWAPETWQARARRAAGGCWLTS